MKALGRFLPLNVQVKSSDIHRRAAVYAIMHEQRLSSFIEEAVEAKLVRVKETIQSEGDPGSEWISMEDIHGGMEDE